jgi:kynurenine formamidase
VGFLWLSYVIDNQSPLYGREKGRILLQKEKSIDGGDSCYTMYYQFPNHIGTHIDAPRHFFNDGKPLDAYPAEYWIFNNVKVVSLENVDAGDEIGLGHINIREIPKHTECLLLKTGFGRFRKESIYWQNSPYLSVELAEKLKGDTNIRIIGIDFISVSNIRHREVGCAVHRTLLSNTGKEPVLIVEDMDLSLVKTDIKKLIIMPLRVRGTDGGPCSVIAEI